MEKILNSLNKEQRMAVKSDAFTTLVLAGAGSGKTRVLTSRIAYLIDMGVDPHSILALTFTNKASKDMKRKLIDILNELDSDDIPIETDLTVGTFHGFCNKVLRRYSSYAGLEKNFTILDTDDTKKLVREAVTNLGFGAELEKREKTQKIKEVADSALKIIGDYKDNGLNVSDLSSSQADINFFGFDPVEIYREYEEIKSAMKALDYGDLILLTVNMFKKYPNILEVYREGYRHILVDEYQDTNTIQSMLIDLMFVKNQSYLFVVGDDDQSIYEWRGANIKNILNFPTKYKNTKVVKLEQNYRSTNNILQCANNLISHNKGRMGKNLWSAKQGGKQVIEASFSNAYDEAEFVADEIAHAVMQGSRYEDFAILYRTNFISRIIESKLNEKRIPYTIIGGTGFWSRMEIKDLMAYFTLTVNKDNNMAFDKVVNLPSRKIGAKKLEQISEESRKNNISRFEALKRLCDEKKLKGEARLNAMIFIDLIEKANQEERSLSEKIKLLIEESGLIDHYLDKDGDEKGNDRVDNLNELLNAAIVFEQREHKEDTDEFEFIDYSALQSNADKEKDGDSVQMMTIHASKGLEFPKVFVLALEDGVFPSKMSIEEGRIEEERRLAYVAITRAEKELCLSHSGERFPGSPSIKSRFFAEIPKELLLSKDNRRKAFERSRGFDYGASRKINYNNNNIPVRFRTGQIYSHDKFGRGIILSTVDQGDRYQVTVNFSGMIGKKTLFIEKK